jgi:HEAT repeat protein
MRRLQGHGFDERVIQTIARFLDDANEWVRTEAVEKIGSFRTEPALVEALLVRALNDSSPMVQCGGLWNVFYRGPHLVSALLPLADSSCDRVAAEAIWALSMSSEGKRHLQALSRLEDVNRPLTASARKWSERPDR